jgi:hypothetical protein
MQALRGFDINPAKLGVNDIPMFVHVLVGGGPPDDQVAAKFTELDLRADPADHLVTLWPQLGHLWHGITLPVPPAENVLECVSPSKSGIPPT